MKANYLKRLQKFSTVSARPDKPCFLSEVMQKDYLNNKKKYLIGLRDLDFVRS